MLRSFDILLVDLGDLVRGRFIKEMRTIVRRIGRIGIYRIERDLVFLDVRIVQRLMVVQVAADFAARREVLSGEVMVAEVGLIFFERVFLNKGAEVLELLRPLVSEFDDQENHAAQEW